MDIPYQEINSKTIDRWVEEGWDWGKPVSHEEYEKAKAGTWDVKLTPVKFVPHRWLGELKGKRVLGLASGGGQQMPIFAALGAQCTVLDYSQQQLDSAIVDIQQVLEDEHFVENLLREIRVVFADRVDHGGLVGRAHEVENLGHRAYSAHG